MTQSTLITASNSILLAVDIQEKLLPAIHNHVSLLHRTTVLLDVARKLDIPRVFSEHCVDKIGPTIPFLTSTAGEHHTLTKTHFSLAAEPGAIADLAGMEKRQVIIIGIEAHVCVLQSAIGLLENGFEVYLVSDAIGSRSRSHVDDAIRRAETLGIQVVNTEMVLFEWLHRADTEVFKQVLPAIKKLLPSPENMNALTSLFDAADEEEKT